MEKIGFLDFFGSFLPPHDLRPLLADAKIVSGELDRGSRTLEAEVESRENMPDAARGGPGAAAAGALRIPPGAAAVCVGCREKECRAGALWQAHQGQARLPWRS